MGSAPAPPTPAPGCWDLQPGTGRRPACVAPQSRQPREPPRAPKSCPEPPTAPRDWGGLRELAEGGLGGGMAGPVHRHKSGASPEQAIGGPPGRGCLSCRDSQGAEKGDVCCRGHWAWVWLLGKTSCKSKWGKGVHCCAPVPGGGGGALGGRHGFSPPPQVPVPSLLLTSTKGRATCNH